VAQLNAALHQNKAGFLLGIDVGNTKTHALITDLNGEIVGFGKSGCGNYEAIGAEGFADVMNAVTNESLTAAQLTRSDILSMGFGLAGYDWPAEEQIMITGIDSLGIDSPFIFVNDAVIGLIAGSSEGWGVAVDAGTGNNVRGRDQSGRMGRITGNSIRFGEIGGAGEIVWRAVIAVTYAWTKRGRQTKLTQLLLDYSGISDESALIEAMAMEQVQPPAELAPEVFRIAAGGDKVAQEVITYTAQELAKSTNAVIKQLNFQDIAFEIILMGSVFKAGEIFIRPFSEVVHAFAPQASLIHLKKPPVLGSVLLAAEAVDLPPEPIRENLFHSTEWLEEEFNN